MTTSPPRCSSPGGGRRMTASSPRNRCARC
jgi:hypothetical protein